jgi:hypothetical protein
LLCATGLVEGLVIVQRVIMQLWDKILEPTLALHLHNMLVKQGYLKKEVGLYTTLKDLFPDSFFPNGVKIMDMCHDDGKPIAVDQHLMKEARKCPEHEFFEPDMHRRMVEQGLDGPVRIAGDEWKHSIPWREADIGSTFLSGTLQDSYHSVVYAGQDWGMYEGLGSELGRVRLYISSSPEARARAAQSKGNMMNLEYEPHHQS